MTLRGKKVLVTGATGFIGGRLVEKLVLEQGASVRVLVRNFGGAVRLARLPLEMMPGNVGDEASVMRASEGCDFIFHCAYEAAAKAPVEAAANAARAVARAAAQHRVARLVHVSTVSVYGPTADGDLDETSPRIASSDAYANAKAAAEAILLESCQKHGLPLAVVQPTVVYGPFGGVWTVTPILQLKRTRVVLVNGGTGLCNAVYVDDVADAMLLAATQERAVGETFLISGEPPVAWRQFYAAYERMLGAESTVGMSVGELQEYARQQRKDNSTMRQVMRAVRTNPKARRRLLHVPAVARAERLVHAIVPEQIWNRMEQRFILDGGKLPTLPSAEEKPLLIPDAARIALMTPRTSVCIEKAKRLLGYQPRFGFERGMELTARWAAWANLLEKG